MTFPFPARPRGGVWASGQTWAPSSSLASNGTGDGGISFRQVLSSVTQAGDQVRVTINASTAGALAANNVSIAKVNSATAPNCDSTPVELKFSGASGFSLASSGVAVSDWLDFRVAVGDNIMVIIDFGATANPRFVSATTNCHQYFKAATASYTSATASGFSDGGSRDECISLLESRKTQ
jgi:hypothetical protein